MLATVSRAGYTFDGWYTSASGGSLVTSASTVSTASNHTLYAQWTPASYTVTFNGNGGGTSSPTSMSVTFGSSYGTLATVSRTGYTFNGWYTAASGGALVASASTVSNTSDHTLYAHWTADSYTVTSDGNGGGTPSPASKSVTYDSTYGTLATVSRTGYSFDGWYTSASGGSLVTSATAVSTASSHTLYAHWAINTYTLTYTADVNGSISGTSPQIVNHGADGTPVTAVANTGYHFVQWSDASTANPRTDSNVTGNISVTATFVQDEYTFTVNSTHGTVTKAPDQPTYHYGDVVTLSVTPEAGWTFTGWTPALVGNQVTIHGNTTVTANYTQDEYTLTVNSMHGTVTKSPDQSTYHYGNVVTLNATPGAGWTFSGWTPSLTNNQVTITGNTTVTANFTQDEYTLMVNSAHGTVSKSPNQATYHYGDVVTLSVTSDAGWTFSSWSPSLTNNQVTITSNTTVTANYTQDEYTLTVNSAHGTVSKSPNQATYHYGDMVTLSVTPDAGWTFSSWTPSLANNQVTITGDTTVTANFVSSSAIFADVPNGYWAKSFIETLYLNQITGGCGGTPLNYCPEQNVTRAQMAVFLLKAKYGVSYTPPAATGTVFLDVAQGSFAAAFIEALAAEGITGGCGNGNYCPNSPVTHAMMAVFLVKAMYGVDYNPPEATGAVFLDVP